MNHDDVWTRVEAMLAQLRSEGFGVRFADEVDLVDAQEAFNTVQNARPSLRPMYNNP